MNITNYKSYSKISDLELLCTCCTHTLNGEIFGKDKLVNYKNELIKKKLISKKIINIISNVKIWRNKLICIPGFMKGIDYSYYYEEE